MLSDILREKTDKWIAKHRKEQLKEAEARGRAESQKLWQDWNARRLEHEAAGKPFHEPPPSLD